MHYGAVRGCQLAHMAACPGPRAAAAVPVRRKSRREMIAAGRVVVGFVMSVLSPGRAFVRSGCKM